MITIDFETRSRCDLKESGAYAYAAHPSTEILCLVWCDHNDKIHKWSPFKNYGGDLKKLRLELENTIFEAHNSEFEWAIWNYCGVKKYGFPPLPQDKFFCSAAICASLSLPRDLFTAGQVLAVPQQKDMTGYMLMMKMCKPDSKGNWIFDEEKLDRLTEYCEKDVLTEMAICKKIHVGLNDTERLVFHANARMNRRGIPVDVYSIKIAQNFLEKYSEEKRDTLRILTQDKVQTEGQLAKILEFIKEDSGLELPGLDASTVSETLKYANLTQESKRVLEIRQALSLSSVKKIRKMRDIVMPDNRIRGSMLYCGASRTGRWSSKGVQFQNLAKGTGTVDVGRAFELIERGIYGDFIKEFPDVARTLSECVRGFIQALEGKIFLAGDYASIEVRVLFWLAGQMDALGILEKDGDLYKEMAASLYNKHVGSISKSERQLGKAVILGAGYGMGFKKFIETCAKPPYNMEVSEELSKLAVYGYRSKYKKVPEFWKACEEAFKNCIKYPHQIFQVGKIAMRGESDRVIIRLPSGRKLYYFNAKIEVVDFKTKKSAEEIEDQEGIKMTEQISYVGMDSESHKWGKLFTYGGKIVENITQACARDIMAEAMLKLEEKKYPPIFTVHDEIVCEVSEDFGNVEEFTKIMEEKPYWAKGCPIKVEADSFHRYKK